MRDPRHDILFEPVRLGPVVAPNRFYQVPHCSGMGWQRPQALAAMRGVKAEGGWGVVCTEYCSIHPSSDDLAYPYASLWDEEDVRAQALMTEAVHAHGALAGVELWMGGGAIANLSTRAPPLGLRSLPPASDRSRMGAQSRRLDRDDIRALRRWHADAARRAVRAGFDIVYVYATHGYLLSEFLHPSNDRADEYGGPLANRVRLVRELIEETREAVGARAAVATRFSATLGDAESYDAFGLLAELPDLWDLTIDDYDVEMGSSRFVKEGSFAGSVGAAKALTSKPVVAVGRYTTPDTMARVIREGLQDLIGAARPSIADPFLPRKIAEGRTDDIRECIGCNICYAHNSMGVPIRCTQNPTMGDEWRRGWHPERLGRATAPGHVLIVGGGPAGLEAARVAGERGWSVTLAETGRTLGGRVTRESALPGLSEWARVRDWRLGRLAKLPQVEIYRESPMTAADALAVGASRILVATGAAWTTDGIGRDRDAPWPAAPEGRVIGVDAILDGARPGGRVLIYDDDRYYMAAALALLLADAGATVTVATPAGRPAQWSATTGEQRQTLAALIRAGVDFVTNVTLEAFDGERSDLACAFTGRPIAVSAEALVPLTRREPRDDLWRDLVADPAALAAHGVASVSRIGDCAAPGLIAHAVYGGFEAAVALGEENGDAALLRRERPPPW